MTSQSPIQLRRAILAFVAAGAIFINASGCASIPQIHSEEPESVRPGETVYVLMYSLSSPSLGSPLGRCSLLIQRLSPPIQNPSSTESDRFKLSIGPSREALLLRLEPGKYQLAELDCGSNLHWSFEKNPHREFNVPADRVSIGNTFAFTVTPKNGDSANAELEVGAMDRPTSTLGIRKTLEALPPNVRNTVLSAVTLKPILPEALDEHDTGIQRVQVLDSQKLKHGPNQVLDAKDCYTSEGVSNQLWIGTVRYRATYRAHKLLKKEKLSDTSTFSTSFLKCVETAIDEFQPSFEGTLEYHLVF